MGVTKNNRFRQIGFSLIELLVAIVVAMTLMVVVMTMFADSESAKRNVSSGGESQSNGAMAVYALSRELRFAGLGMNTDAALGCTLSSHNTGRAGLADLRIDLLSPVRIFAPGAAANLGNVALPAGDAGSNIILMVYGSSTTSGEGVGFNDLIASKNGYSVKNRIGFQVGDVVLAAQGIQQPCLLLQVTALPGTTDICGVADGGDTDLLRFGVAAFSTPYSSTGACVSVSSAINTNPLAASFSASGYSAVLSNMGPSPQIVAFTVRNGNLVRCDLLTTNCADATKWDVISSNVVGLQALYGHDTTGPADGTVDVFDTPANFTPATRCDVSRIGAIRIGVLARNAQQEKRDSANNPVTPNAPTWSGGTFTLPAGGNDYRYKVFETTVPLRNMVWRGAVKGC